MAPIFSHTQSTRANDSAGKHKKQYEKLLHAFHLAHDDNSLEKQSQRLFSDSAGINSRLSELDDEELLGAAPQEVEMDAMADIKLALGGEHDKPWYMIDPEGWQRQLWDTVASAFMVFMIISYPVWAGFYDPSGICTYFNPYPVESFDGARTIPVAWLMMQSITNGFFLADIVVNFLTGTLVRDEVGEMVAAYDLRSTAVHYLMRWFLFEAAACVPLECILEETVSQDRIWINWGYLIRFLRLFGFQRRNVFNIISWLYDLLAQQVAMVGLRIDIGYSYSRALKMATIVICFIHLFACGIWFTIRAMDFPPGTWPVLVNVAGNDIPVATQYAWSFFCSVSGTVGVSYGSYPPFTWQEVVLWSVLMIVMAAMWFLTASFVTAAVLSSVSGRGKFHDHMQAVEEVMQVRDVPDDIQDRVIKYMHYKYSDGLLVDDDKVLRDLPYSLRVEVALLSAGTLLQQINLLRDDPLLLEECSLLVKPSYAVADELLVKEGFPCSHVYFIVSGYVELRRDDVLMTTLGPGKRFNDHALLPLPSEQELKADPSLKSYWSPLIRGSFPAVASSRAITNCFFYTLEGAEFAKVLEEFPEALRKLQSVADRHLRVLTSMHRQPTRRAAFAEGAAAAAQATAVEQAAIRRQREHNLATKSFRASTATEPRPAPGNPRTVRGLAAASMPTWLEEGRSGGGRKPTSSSLHGPSTSGQDHAQHAGGIGALRSLFSTDTLSRFSRGAVSGGHDASSRTSRHPHSRLSLSVDAELGRNSSPMAYTRRGASVRFASPDSSMNRISEVPVEGAPGGLSVVPEAHPALTLQRVATEPPPSTRD